MSAARDVLEMLRRHYLPDPAHPAGIFAPEIKAPGPSGRRADLIWQGCTAASGHELVGHEIKVTRGDVLAELADHRKSDPWQACCDRWYLVVPDAALLDGVELPATWGVLTPPSGRRTRSMTVTVPAPKLHPAGQAAGLRTLATWAHWRHHDTLSRLKSTERHNDTLRAQYDQIRAQVPTQGPTRAREHETVTRILRELGGVNIDGGVGNVGAVDVTDVLAALRGLGEVYDRARDVQWRAEQVVRGLAAATRGIDPAALADLDAKVTALRAERPGENR